MNFDYINKALTVIDKYTAKVFLKSGLYRRTKINGSNKDLLENKHPFLDPECVCLDYKYDNPPTVDVSIIVPLYNSEKHLQDLYRMLSNQKTSYSYEVILINDGSTDDTYKKALKITKDNEIFRCYSKINGGISSARNYGIQRSKGRYIGFMDHDDVIDQEYIQKLLNTAYSHGADIVRCLHGDIYNGKILRKDIAGGYIWGGIRKTYISVCEISGRVLV